MKTSREIAKELLVIGATRRLEELNEERKYLIRVIERNTQTKPLQFQAPVKRRAKRKVKGAKRPMWSSTPEGRARMSEIRKKWWKDKKNANVK